MLKFIMRISGIICGFISIILFSFSRQIILFLFAGVYSDSIAVLRIFSLALYLIVSNTILSTYFYSINKPVIPLISTFITFLLYFAFNLVFIPLLKSAGPALSTVLIQLILTLIFTGILFARKVNFLKDFMLVTVCMCVVVLAGFYVSYYIAIPVFLACVYVTKAIRLDDYYIMRRVVLGIKNEQK